MLYRSGCDEPGVAIDAAMRLTPCLGLRPRAVCEAWHAEPSRKDLIDMTRANNSKWMCILAFVLMVIPAVVSVGQAAAAPGAADRAMSSTAASVRSEPVGKLQLNGPRGIC